MLPGVIYHSICRKLFFMYFKFKKTYSSVYGIRNESLSSKHLKSYWINPNIIKYREFGESKVPVKLHSNKPPTFLLVYAITNEMTVKLM